MHERLYSQPDLTPNFNGLSTSPTVPKLIGLSGYARSGKDTVAGIITGLFGHHQVSFAAKLKELAYDLDPVVGTVNFGREEARLASYVDNIGWEKSKENPEVRRILQVLGTRVRHHLGSDIWVLAAMRGLTYTECGHVFSDVRFPNEADEIQRRGGLVYRVVRPGIEAINAHVSEIALDAWDFDGIINNDGTISDLEGEVQRVLGAFS